MKLKDMMHKECGGVAYLYNDKEYYALDVPLASDFFHLDCSPSTPYEPMACGTCGKYIEFTIVDSHLVATTRVLF